jgi:RNase P subunit RPR2
MQRRDAWCRSCGAKGRYPTGWSLMSVPDFEAFQKALGRAVSAASVGSPDQLCVRLRLRNLACVRCGTVGTLVAGRKADVTARASGTTWTEPRPR